MEVCKLLTRAGVLASAFAAFAAFSQPASAVTFDVVGLTSSDNTASIDFDYDAALGKITLGIENTAAFNAAITGFAFNVPSNVTGVSSFMADLVNDASEDNWYAIFASNGVGSPQSIGFFDLGATSVNNANQLPNDLMNGVSDDPGNINSGSVNNGIQVNESATFMFQLTGTDLDLLTESSFLSLLSVCNQGNCDPQSFAVRFQRTGADGLGSDVGVPSTVIPLPASLPLFLAALAGLGIVTRRRRAA